MSDLENKKTEETPKKRPYNLREKKEKKAAYRSLIRPELADELYDKILNIIVVQKKYKDPDYSAKDLAKELKTNTRYLSAVVNSRFGMNYSCQSVSLLLQKGNEYSLPFCSSKLTLWHELFLPVE